MASELDLIDTYFRGLGAARADVALGIGDDAALLRVARTDELVLTTDALVEGVHFLPGASAHSLGHRALAVNLSDVAAMGGSAAWMLLSLVLPQVDDAWLRAFSSGMSALAVDHNVALVGGNLSRGPLSITIALAGCVPAGQALRRDGARAGEDLYVSGTLGDAGAGRELLQRAGDAAAGDAAAVALEQRFCYPQPRLALGQALRGLASACIDVSDGLYVDASRLLRASGCAAEIDGERLPLSAALRGRHGEQAVRFALFGGEDYELCFTAPASRGRAIEALADRLTLPISRIGRLTGGAGLKVKSVDASLLSDTPSFDHFRH